MNTTTRGNRLDVFVATVELTRCLRPVFPRVKRISSSLENQMRRALESCGVNIVEGQAHVGGSQLQAWRIARGSAREVHGALEIAEAMGLEHDALEEAYALLDRIHAMLYRMTH